MNQLREDLFSTLANELNNNSEWTFDGRHVVQAAVSLKDGGLHLALSDGKTVLEHYTITIRRNNERTKPQTRRRERPARLRGTKS